MFKKAAMQIVNFKKKTMNSLTKEQEESWENAKFCHICKKGKSEDKYLKDKKYRQVRDHCRYTKYYRGAAHSICNSKYSVPINML